MIEFVDMQVFGVEFTPGIIIKGVRIHTVFFSDDGIGLPDEIFFTY